MLVENRRSRAAALLLALTLFAVACGTGSTVRQTSAELPDPPNASAGLLKLSDLPAGWTIAEDDGDDSSGDDDDMDCGQETVETSDIDSKDFEKDVSQVSNSVAVYDSVAEATADFALLRDDALLGCLRDYFVKFFAEPEDGMTFADVAFERLPTASKFGDEMEALRLSANLLFEGQTIPIIADLVFVRVGAKMVAYLFVDARQAFDEALRNQLIDVTIKRLTAR